MINYEYPPLGGGAGTATRETALALARLGHAVTVLTSGFRGLPPQENDGGVSVIRVPTLRRHAGHSTPFEMAVFTLSALRRAPAVAAAFRPDVAVCWFSIPSGIVGRRLLHRTGVPYMVSLRGGDVPGFHPGALAAWHRLTLPMTRGIWRSAAAVTTNADNLRQLALRVAPGLDITVIPNGVDTERFHPVAEKQPDPARQTVLFVGRLNSQKGLDALLSALGRIRDRPPSDFHLVLAGAGPEENRLKEQAGKLGLSNMVEFRGWIPPERIPGIYREADFLVLPSRDEGMPNVALEAMASGLPVITT